MGKAGNVVDLSCVWRDGIVKMLEPAVEVDARFAVYLNASNSRTKCIDKIYILACSYLLSEV